MAKLTIGGKPAKATARKRPDSDMASKPFVDPSWGVVNADPFHVDTDKTPEYRAGYLAEMGMWASQGLDELAALTRKAHRLDNKLRCPDLADSPHRDAAVRESLRIEADVIQRVRDLVMEEGQADRVWQSLTPDERGAANADFMWGTPATDDRLIGVTWFRLARHFEWPPGFRILRQWVQGLPLTVVMDLRLFKVYRWNPNPRPPSLFDEPRHDPIPDELKDEMLKGLKS